MGMGQGTIGLYTIETTTNYVRYALTGTGDGNGTETIGLYTIETTTNYVRYALTGTGNGNGTGNHWVVYHRDHYKLC